MPYLYLIGAFFLNAGANIILKIAAKQGGGIWNSLFLSGLGLFAANAVLYFLALRALPISLAYPIMVSMSLLIIETYAYLVLGEKVTWLQVIGFILITLGITLAVYARQ